MKNKISQKEKDEIKQYFLDTNFDEVIFKDTFINKIKTLMQPNRYFILNNNIKYKLKCKIEPLKITIYSIRKCQNGN